MTTLAIWKTDEDTLKAADSYELVLYLRGKELDVSLLTSILGTTPTDSRMRGEERRSKTGVSVKTKVGFWSLSAFGASPSESVASMARAFGGQLRDLSSLPGVEEAYFDMFVTFEPGENTGSEVNLDWEPDALQELARSKLPLVITFAVIGLGGNRAVDLP